MKKTFLFHKLLLTACGMLLLPCVTWADLANPLTGSYYGSVTIDVPTEDMATVDLAFYFDVDGTQLVHDNSCIRLDKTMLFPEVNSPLEIWALRNGENVLIESIEAGPRMTGTFSLDSFSIESDEFTNTVGDKEVTRKIVLSDTTVDNNVQFISGTYTETVTGLLVDPVVISGSFTLLKPVPPAAAVFQDSNDDGCLDRDEIRTGGDDPARMEFWDASGAMSIYHNPPPVGDGPALCAPADQTMQDIMKDFYCEKNPEDPNCTP